MDIKKKKEKKSRQGQDCMPIFLLIITDALKTAAEENEMQQVIQ